MDWTNLITDLVDFELEIFKKPVFDKYSLAWQKPPYEIISKSF